MPVVKIYDIVTNDKYEFPVKHNLIGAKQVAQYIGVTENTVRKYICRGWHGKYKAIEIGRKKPEGQSVWEKRYRMKGAVS